MNNQFKPIPPQPKAALWLLWIILIFAPLALGSVTRWAITLVEGGTCVALFLFLFHGLRYRSPLYRVPGLLPMLLGLGYLLLQTLPLPPGLVKLVSPAAWEIWTNPAIAQNAGQWICLSVYPHATWLQFFRIACYGIFYILVIQILTRSQSLKQTVAVITLFSMGLAVFAIVQHLSSDGKIYWSIGSIGSGVSGPFFNRNHWAGFMEMTLPLALAIFLYLRPRTVYRSLRLRLAEMFSRQTTDHHLLTGFGVVMMGVSVLMSLSRSGIVCLGLSLLFFTLLLRQKRVFRNREMIVIVVAGCMLLFLTWAGWGPIANRFDKLLDEAGNLDSNRPVYWHDSAGIVRDYPLAGSGVGTFETIYPSYRTITGYFTLKHAHSDWIEVPAEAGGIGVLLGLWFLGAVVVSTLRGVAKRKDLYAILLPIGCLTGVFSILCHSVTDFNLQIGANGLYFSFLLGLAVSASHTRHHRIHDSSLSRTSGKLGWFGYMAASLALLGGIVWFNGRGLVGDYCASYMKGRSAFDIQSQETLQPMAEVMEQAVRWDPMNANHALIKADLAWQLKDVDQAAKVYDRAVRLSPANGNINLARALFYAAEMPNTQVDGMFRTAIRRFVVNPAGYREYARWLFAQNQREEASNLITRSIAMQPTDNKNTRQCLVILVVNGVSDDDIGKLLPERVQPHLAFAEYLAALDSPHAADAYEKALSFVEKEPKVNVRWFWRANRYFAKEKRDEDRLRLFKRAVAAVDNHAGLRVQLARLYEKQGFSYRAEEEYRQALLLDPDNKVARRFMEKIDGNQ